MRDNRGIWKPELIAIVVLLSALAYLAPLGMGVGESDNWRNVSVTTQVNITNSIPEIINVTITPGNATLNAGGQTEINVSVEVRDFDGFQDIDTVRAVFFDSNVVVSNSSDNNTNHYTNSSCNNVTGEASGFYQNFTCSFDVWYYANNGTAWTANVTVNDSSNFNATDTDSSTIDKLLAINVTDLIDYGNLQVGEINDPTREANVTNIGNVLINISVYGYGNQTDDGLAMVCDQRNISIDNQRFDLNITEPFNTMTPMTSNPQDVGGLQLPQRTNEAPSGVVRNSTYWRLRVPTSTNPAGQCNGTLIFQAELPS